MPLNEDIMDQAGGRLRPGLSESADFEIVNEQIYELLKLGQGFEIKRQSYLVGTEKKVPVYLQTINYLRLESKTLKDIDFKRIKEDELRIKTLEISDQMTIDKTITEIAKKERLAKDCKIRLWKSSGEMTMPLLFKYIKEKCAPLTGFYRIDGVGKKI